MDRDVWRHVNKQNLPEKLLSCIVARPRGLAGMEVMPAVQNLVATIKAGGRNDMYGLIIKTVTNPGKRDEYIRALSSGFVNMAGCHSYILAEDPEDENVVWVTEIWESHEAHEAALKGRADIQAVIASSKAQKLADRRELRVITKPIAGQGLFKGDGAWRPEHP